MRRGLLTLLAGLALAISPGCGSDSSNAPSPPLAPTQAAPPPTQFPAPPTQLQSGPVTFSGVGGEGMPVATYSELGFTIQATAGTWQAGANYGNPLPFIRFQAQGGATIAGELVVTAGGQTFSFTGVDLYSSTTPIPYQITGLRNSATVFTASATLGNTFGNFRTVASPEPSVAIDTLKISLVNAAAPCCPNPMGLDNITLVK